MVSKNLIKLIRSLEQKKYRIKENLFVAEGCKVVADLMAIQRPRRIVATENWYADNGDVPTDVVVSDEELRKISFLQHPQQVLALFELPETTRHLNGSEAQEGFIKNQNTDSKNLNTDSKNQNTDSKNQNTDSKNQNTASKNRNTASKNGAPDPSRDLIIALDGVQDPGNMGTIIRIADWFGITDIVCSNDTVDAYGPKVVQATMGSIARVRLWYTDLPAYLSSLGTSAPVYGTFLDGDDIYSRHLESHGVIVMGNEGKGVTAKVASLATEHLLIHNYPSGRETADSLNVAIATAITCAEFRRRALLKSKSL